MSERSSAALQDMAHRLRIHSIESTSAAGSGHPTSCCSMAEIMAVLFFDAMKYEPTNPRNPNNDKLVLSKGHAAPILYAAWAEAGNFPIEHLLQLRKIDSDLEGHPTPRLPFVDMATGSLGQGLSVGCGLAYSGKRLDKAKYRVYVVLGDGESAEGAVWEAVAFASHYQLDNLCAIVDVNRLGQSEPTMLQHDVETYQKRFKAFGWNTFVVDGHDVSALAIAFDKAARVKRRPTVIIAKTLKGKDIPGVEDQENWHGKPLGEKTAQAVAHLRSLMTGADGLTPKRPVARLKPPKLQKIVLPPPEYTKGQKVATRLAYGTALAKLGAACDRAVALDGDTKNSTYSDKFKAACPDRFVECYIAEQNLVGVGAGLAARGKLVFLSTFACFLTRAFDQIRMAGISRSQINLAGSHVGVSIGADGPSQMGLEDIAMFRTIPGCVVFYPSDAVAAEKAVELAANYHGMTFIRTGRPANPVVYENNEQFSIGHGKVLKHRTDDQVTVVAAGVTLHETIAAAEILAREGIAVRIIDPFTVKPLDKKLIADNARQTHGRILTVEDHYIEGGLGDAVAGELAEEPGLSIYKLAITEIPHSGEPEELLDRYGVSARHIVEKVKKIIAARRRDAAPAVAQPVEATYGE